MQDRQVLVVRQVWKLWRTRSTLHHWSMNRWTNVTCGGCGRNDCWKHMLRLTGTAEDVDIVVDTSWIGETARVEDRVWLKKIGEVDNVGAVGGGSYLEDDSVEEKESGASPGSPCSTEGHAWSKRRTFRASSIHRPESSRVKLILIQAVEPAHGGPIIDSVLDNVLRRVIAFLPWTSWPAGPGIPYQSRPQSNQQKLRRFLRLTSRNRSRASPQWNVTQPSGIIAYNYEITQHVEQQDPILALTTDLEAAGLIQRWRSFSGTVRSRIISDSQKWRRRGCSRKIIAWCKWSPRANHRSHTSNSLGDLLKVTNNNGRWSERYRLHCNYRIDQKEAHFNVQLCLRSIRGRREKSKQHEKNLIRNHVWIVCRLHSCMVCFWNAVLTHRLSHEEYFRHLRTSRYLSWPPVKSLSCGG